MADAPPPLPGSGPPPLPGAAPPSFSFADVPLPDDKPVAKAPPTGRLFPCLNCGAKVEFDPSSRSLKCPYCGHTQTVAGPEDSEEEVVERDFEEYLEKQEENAAPAEGMESQVRCTGCGAMVIVDEKIVTDDCPFCGTHIENQPESVAGMIPPESLVPFELDLRAARTAFDKWLHSLWFAPTALKKLALLGQLNGIYVPYWTYDAMTYTRYRGQRGDNYTVSETYTDRDSSGNSVTRTRNVTKIRWYSVRGEVERFFDDVLICGSKSLPKKLVLGMEPWNTQELEPYKSDFLSGFRTERYVIGLSEGFTFAKQRMEPKILDEIHADIGGDHQRVEWKSTQYLGVTFKHCLLPVWVAHYRFHDKLFHILVNGRTGKVSGERPYSWAKILSLVFVVLLVLGLVFYFASRAKGNTSTPKPPRRAGNSHVEARAGNAGTPWQPASILDPTTAETGLEPETPARAHGSRFDSMVSQDLVHRNPFQTPSPSLALRAQCRPDPAVF